MKKLFFGGVLFLTGWFGIVLILCSGAIKGGWDRLGDFIKWNQLRFPFVISVLFFFLGAWYCIREVYLRKMLDELDRELEQKKKLQ